jgi:hypothetical protein
VVWICAVVVLLLFGCGPGMCSVGAVWGSVVSGFVVVCCCVVVVLLLCCY